MTVAEILGVITGALGIFLIARERVWGWPVSIVSSAVYVFIFIEAKLYADAGLQVCYVVLCAYGWFAWWRGSRDGQVGGGGAEVGAEVGVDGVPPIRVRRAPAAHVRLALITGAVTSGILFLLLRQTDAALPWLDAPTTAFSLVGQWMQARKWVQNWALWIVVDLVYVGLYVMKALYLTAGLYLLFAGLAVMGWMAWHRTLAERTTAPTSSF